MAKVSIIIPVCRVDEALYRSVDSVLQQTHGNWELVFAHTIYEEQINVVVRKYADDRIATVSGMDMSDSIAKAMDSSLSEYVTILYAGDIMHSEKLRIQLKRMARNPDITICSSWMHPLSNDILSMRVSRYDGYIENPLLSLLNGNFVYRSTAVVRRSFMRNHDISFGGQYKSCGEYGLWFDIFRRDGTIYIEPQCLVYIDMKEGKEKMLNTDESLALRYDILKDLLEKVKFRNKRSALSELLKSFDLAKKTGVISFKMMLDIFYIILARLAKADGDMQEANFAISQQK